MKEAKKADVIRDLRRIQKRIWRIPIDLREPKQVETLKFAAASVDTVIAFLNDIEEFHYERSNNQ